MFNKKNKKKTARRLLNDRWSENQVLFKGKIKEHSLIGPILGSFVKALKHFLAASSTLWGRNENFLKPCKINTQKQVPRWEFKLLFRNAGGDIFVLTRLSREHQRHLDDDRSRSSAGSTGGRAGNQERQKALSHRLTCFDRRRPQTSLLLLYCFSRRSQGRRAYNPLGGGQNKRRKEGETCGGHEQGRLRFTSHPVEKQFSVRCSCQKKQQHWNAKEKKSIFPERNKNEAITEKGHQFILNNDAVMSKIDSSIQSSFSF